ncbi:MAG TPA: VWA domain-containing protein, partial [Vicinamibacterales bacterium]
DGRQIADLTSANFTLAVDGQARAIESVQYVSSPARSGATQAPEARPSAASRSAFSHLVFFIDEGNISTGNARAAVGALGRMLGRFGPGDRLALLTVPSGPSVDFTDDHERIRTALGRVVGRASPLPAGDDFNLNLTETFAFDTGASAGDRALQDSIVLRECPLTMPSGRREVCEQSLRSEASARLEVMHERARTTRSALDKLIDSLAKMSGPKAIVLLSEGLPLAPNHRDDASITGTASRAALADIRVFVLMLDGALVDLAVASGRGRPSSTTGSADRSIVEDGLRTIAAASGGVLERVPPVPDRAMDRVADLLAGHYVVAFRVEPRDREGTHQIKLTVSRPGTTVVARSQFRVTASEKPSTTTAAPVSAPVSRRSIRSSSLDIDKINLRVATRAIAEPDGSVRILLSVDVRDPRPTPVTALALGYKLVSGDRVLAETGQVVPVTRGADGQTDPISYIAFRNIPAGRYSLQLSASDGSKHAGFVSHNVDATLLPVGAYRLSDILLAESAPNDEGPYPVHADVTVRRQVVAGVEVTAPSETAFENAEVRFAIAGRGASAASSGRDVSLKSTSGPSQFVRATLDCSQLAAGEYVVKVGLVVGGATIGETEARFQIVK